MKLRSALVAVALAALVGCNGETAPTTAPPTVTPTPTVATSPSVTPTPTVSAETQAIEDGLMEYLRVLDKFLRDPSLTDLTETQYVTTGEESGLVTVVIRRMRENGRKRGGEVKVIVEKVEDSTVVNGVTVSKVTYCRDLTRMVFLDAKTGAKVDVPGAPAALREKASMELMPNGKWVVSNITNEAVSSC